MEGEQCCHLKMKIVDVKKKDWCKKEIPELPSYLLERERGLMSIHNPCIFGRTATKKFSKITKHYDRISMSNNLEFRYPYYLSCRRWVISIQIFGIKINSITWMMTDAFISQVWSCILCGSRLQFCELGVNSGAH